MDNYKKREFLEPQEDGTYKLIEWSCLTCPPEDYVEIPEGAEFYMQMRVGLKAGCQFFFKFDDEDLRVLSGSGWQHASYDSIQEYVDEGDQLLWSRETVKKDPALISGAEAKLAWAKGKDVQISHKELDGIDWTDLHGSLMLSVFEADHMYIFRLKPKTIKLELELPKPFEPKLGDLYWCIAMTNLRGYTQKVYKDDGDDECLIHLGAYRTEEEIKQVVEQLRKIRGAS